MSVVFDLKKSSLKGKARIFRISRHVLVKFLFSLLLVACLLNLAVPVLYFLNISPIPIDQIMLGASLILIALGLFLLSWLAYYKSEIVNHQPRTLLFKVHDLVKQGKVVNLADFVSLPCFIAIKKALKKSAPMGIGEVKSSDLIRELLHNYKVGFITVRMGVPSKAFLAGLNKFYEEYKQYDIKHNLAAIIEKALLIAVAEEHESIEVGDVFIFLAKEDLYFGKLAFSMDIKMEDLANIVNWETLIEYKRKKRKFNPDRLKLTGGIGREWAAGYTLALSKFAGDLTHAVAGGLPFDTVIHQKEIMEMEKILSKSTHHNVLLVGEPGIGKETMILFFAERMTKGRTPRALSRRKIMKLNIDYILAGAETPGAIIQRLTAVLQDAVLAGNIMLFINNIHTLFGGGEAKVGSVDASQVLLPFLENPAIYIIATTTTADFHQSIEPRKIAVEKFERINVAEPETNQVIRVLEELVPSVERRSRSLVSYKALKAIVELSDRYMYEKAFPEKAVDLLEEVAANAPNGSIVTDEHVKTVVQNKIGVPVGDLGSSEKQKLLNLEKILHQRVIGQDQAVVAVANALRRARTGVNASKKPLGSFLFLGPTGVGKTETCKALAGAYFDDEDKIIRFDMSEYQDVASLHRLLGAAPGTPEAAAGGQLTNAIKDNPFSLILFDEIEKAHPNILNIFLQLLDEGWLTDSLGRKVRFSNTIIIATSNAGSEFIRQSIDKGLGGEDLKKQLLDYLQREGKFRPEFINRFTEVVSFSPLSTADVQKITGLLVDRLVKRLSEEKGISIEITPPAVAKLAELGYDPLLGARPIARTIQQQLENSLAKKMLSGEVKRGSQLVIYVGDFGE